VIVAGRRQHERRRAGGRVLFWDRDALALMRMQSLLALRGAKEKIIRECIGYRMHTGSQCAQHNLKDIRYFRMCSARHPSVVIVEVQSRGR
jgi:hypothetical protein